MPAAASATRRNRTSHLSKLASSKLSGPYALPLRPDSEESDDAWSDSQSVNTGSWRTLDLSKLDEPKDYQFQVHISLAPPVVIEGNVLAHVMTTSPKQSGSRVWVRTSEHNWRLGKVVKDQSRRRPLARNVSPSAADTKQLRSNQRLILYQQPTQEADYYQVQFGVKGKMNTRKYFAPLNGEMKPDTHLIREMLQLGGWSDFSLLATGELESD